MVGGVTDEERDSFMTKLKAGFVLLVGFSAGLITIQGDAGLATVAAATVAGLVVGLVLLWTVFPDLDGMTRDDPSSPFDRD